MADPPDAQEVSAALAELYTLVHTCFRVAVALIGTGGKWAQGFLGRSLSPTEYENARDATIQNCRTVGPQLLKIRKTILSPEAIWATSTVASIQDCCRRCAAVNQQRLDEGKPFRCEARGELNGKGKQGFRYRLDKKGQIHEIS